LRTAVLMSHLNTMQGGFVKGTTGSARQDHRTLLGQLPEPDASLGL
jgi:hypothetical protein